MVRNNDRQVNLRGEINFQGKRYSLKHIKGINLGAVVDITLKSESVITVRFKGRNYDVSSVVLDAGGFPINAKLIGDKTLKRENLSTKKAKPGMEDIHDLAATVSAAHEAVNLEVQALDRMVNLVYKKHSRPLVRLAKKFSDAKKKLEAAVKAHPEMFEKPKSMQVGDVKVGWKKKKGTLVLPANIEKLIDRMYDMLCADDYDNCTKNTTTVVKAGLDKLTVKTLKQLGIKVVADGNEPFVSITQTGAEAKLESILAALKEKGSK